MAISWCSLVVSTLLFAAVSGDNSTDYELRMPSVRPQRDDLMLCYMRRIDKPVYIVGFTPIYNSTMNHHIIIYGCGESESGIQPQLDEVWNCGEMTDARYYGDNSAPTYQKGPVCFDDQPPQFVWSWALGAPPFTFPDGVSYKVGTKSVRYLVLQLHYKDTSPFRPPSTTVDRAGVELKTVSQPTPKLAGIFLLASYDGVLPAKQISYFDIACRMKEPGLALYPFAFRVHAHANGLVSSGYRIRNGRWTEIGRQSPQVPQTYYNVTNPGMDIRYNDILAVRCTMYNKGDKPIEIGGTQYGEMCNYYVYYYTEGNNIRPRVSFCQSPGPPQDAWTEFGQDLNLSGVPNNVSVVPPPPAGVTAHDHNGDSTGSHGSMSMVADDDGSSDNNMKTYQQNDKIANEGFYYPPSHRVHRDSAEEPSAPDNNNNNNNSDEVEITGDEDDDDNNDDIYRSDDNGRDYYYGRDPYAEAQQEQEAQMARLLSAL